MMPPPYADGDIVFIPSCDSVMQFWRYPDGEEFWVGFGRKAMYPPSCVDLTGATMVAHQKSQVTLA